MRKVFLALLLGMLLVSGETVAAEQSIYDVINAEDEDTFSNMVALGLDIDHKDADGYTPLMIASSLGKVQFVRFLIYNGADVNARSKNGLTALHRAAQDGRTDVIAELIGGGAYINMPDQDGFTPLMVAVMAQQRFCVEFLVKHGANLNFRNANGDSALRISDHKRFYTISTYLREQGASY